MNVSVDGCPSVCVSPASDCQPVQGVSLCTLLPSGSWDRPAPLTRSNDQNPPIVEVVQSMEQDAMPPTWMHIHAVNVLQASLASALIV